MLLIAMLSRGIFQRDHQYFQSRINQCKADLSTPAQESFQKISIEYFETHQDLINFEDMLKL